MKNSWKAFALATVLGAGSAFMAAAPAEARADDPCGYYHSTTTLYYNHCGSGSVIVEVKNQFDVVNRTVCVSPGETSLGAYGRTNHSARSDGTPCGGGGGSW